MEACPLRKSQLKSLDFAINSALRKTFDTKSQNIEKNAEKYSIVYPQSRQLPAAGGNFWRKLLCHKISYAAYLLSMTQKNFLRYDNRGGRTQLKWHQINRFFLHNNYCNIDAISRHCWTVVFVCVCACARARVCVCFPFTFSLPCSHLPCDRWIKIMNLVAYNSDENKTKFVRLGPQSRWHQNISAFKT